MQQLSPMFKNDLRNIKRAIHKLILKVSGKSPIKGHGQFAKRIKLRHQIFWKTPDAEVIRNTMMTADDPMEKWRQGENWQRKLSNKHNAREFAKMHGCKVPNLYWRGRNVNSINFAELPEAYVIRPTIGHSSNMVFLMHDNINLLDEKAYSNEEVRNILAEALSKNLRLEFLLEEFLKTEGGDYKIPVDYKFYMFNGEINSILVISRINSSKKVSNYYDENWNPIQNLCEDYPKGAYQPPPTCFREMIKQAKELSRAYEIFVRIDFYATDKGSVFGEFTPTPGLGDGFTPEGELIFIDYWDSFCKGKV